MSDRSGYAADNLTRMSSRSRGRHPSECVGRAIDEERDRPDPPGGVAARTVYGPTIDRNQGPGRPSQIDGGAEIEPGDISVADRAGPSALAVAMDENRAAMAFRDAGQRPLLGWDIVEINPQRHRAVIGVRPSRDVLMPFDDLTRARPFVIELAAVELDVGPDESGGDVGQHGFRGKAPESGMPIDQRAKPAHMRAFRCVLGADIENLVGRADISAFFQKPIGQLVETVQPSLRDQARGGEIAGFEIGPALCFAQHPRRVSEDLFGRHLWASSTARRRPRRETGAERRCARTAYAR